MSGELNLSLIISESKPIQTYRLLGVFITPQGVAGVRLEFSLVWFELVLVIVGQLLVPGTRRPERLSYNLNGLGIDSLGRLEWILMQLADKYRHDWGEALILTVCWPGDKLGGGWLPDKGYHILFSNPHKQCFYI